MFLTAEETLIVSILLIAGAVVHELGHYFWGLVFRRDPVITGWYFVLPDQVSLNDMDGMANWEVRVFAGYVLVFPLLAGYGLWNQHLYLSAFVIGGAVGISATDLIGLYHPEEWLKMANGESVNFDDFGKPGLW